MGRTKTVAHVITRFDVGGAQETALRIAAGVDREEYDSLIIAGPDVGSGGSLIDRAREAGIEVVHVPSLVGPIRPGRDLAAVRQVGRVLDERDVDLVHTHSSKAGVVGRLAARKAHRPVLHMVHGWSFNDDQRLLTRSVYANIERVLARTSGRLVVVTPQDRDAGIAQRIGRADQYRVVHSGIELRGRAEQETSQRVREEVRRELGLENHAYLVVSVGRLEPQKDPETLVRAFAAAFSGDASVALVLVGDGSQRSNVLDLARRLGVDGAVFVLGLRDDVDRLLVAADAFVLTSRWEGLPRAVLEAMDAGVPVIASDVGGTSDVVVDGRTGILVRPRAVTQTASALRRLRSDPALAARLSSAAEEGLEEYSEASMIAAVEAVYAELLPVSVGH